MRRHHSEGGRAKENSTITGSEHLYAVGGLTDLEMEISLCSEKGWILKK